MIREKRFTQRFDVVITLFLSGKLKKKIVLICREAIKIA